MAEDDKVGTSDNARRVRVEWLPLYPEMRRLLRVWVARPKAHITGLQNRLWELRGTPQKPVDWKDPDTWIAKRVTGEDRELALAVWTRSGVNPRYTDEHWRLTQNYELLAEDVDGKLELTERGSDFIDHEFGKAEAFLDEQEGLIELLTLVTDAGSASRSALLEPWAEYLARHSRYRARTTIDNTLSSRLKHLVDRDLVKPEDSKYTTTKGGRDYLGRVGSTPGTANVPAGIARYADDEDGRTILAALADSIGFAHSLNPECWATLFAGRRPDLRFYVGSTLMLVLESSRKRVEVTLLPRELKDDHQDTIGSVQVLRNYTYPEGARRYLLDWKEFVALWSSIRMAHRETMKQVAMKAPRGGGHRTAAVEFLNKSLGLELPQPEYTAQNEPPDSTMMKAKWDAYLAAARERSEAIYRAELYKKEELAKALSSAREALLRDDPNWPKLVNAAIKHKNNNIIFYVNKTKLTAWIEGNVVEARDALSRMWSEGDRTPGDRVRSFDRRLPENVFPSTAVGTRLNAAAYLMMAVDPESYPPYQRTPFQKAYQWLGYPPSAASDAADEYEYVLDFLDRIIEEARERDMDRPSTRMDAQSVVWQLRDLSENGVPNGESGGFGKLTQSLQDDGLLFSRELVANYILALQTKRFAILTGISGTGKTRIARAVAQYFQPVRQRRVAKPTDDAVHREVKPAHIKFAKLVLPVAISAHLNIETSSTPDTGPQIWVRYPNGRIRLRTFLAAGKNPILQFKGDIRKWFQSTLKVGDQFLIRIHPSDTDDPGELEIGLPEIEVVEQPANNYIVVPVRPDWVDNRGLLGYLNPLTNEYSSTRFLDLLLRAREEEKRAADANETPHPFFVILDEMNLARVEHYFSDFLSALESGEPIPLHGDEIIESGESESGPQIPRQLRIPGNVLFTGTVNVDETTYMFSPKVLDRAFTIEFDQVDLEGFTTGESSDDESGLTLGCIKNSLDLLRSSSIGGDDWKPTRDDWVKFSDDSEEHQKALLQLHNILEAQHRHFGYRVANEIARFVNLAREQAADEDVDAAANAAFDLALLQKVLPKFHGTQQELESLLERIFHFSVHGGDHRPKKDDKVESDDWTVVAGQLTARSKPKSPVPSSDTGSEAGETDSDDAKPHPTAPQAPAYPRTGAKVLRMLQRLRDRGFTSFIE